MNPWLLIAGGGLGFSLGLLGAGGSILAVPALITLAGLAPGIHGKRLLTVGTAALLGAVLDMRGKDTTLLRERLRMAMLLAIPGLVGASAGG
jgi:uncharacterized membrane protein YfcA